MAALEAFFAAAGLKPTEGKLYAAKCDAEGYDVDTIANVVSPTSRIIQNMTTANGTNI